MSEHLIAEANRHAKALDERNDLVVELNLLRQWQREVIQNARGIMKRALLAHHAERKDAIARAERAEAELATERARLDYVLKNDCAWNDRSEIDQDMKNMSGESKK